MAGKDTSHEGGEKVPFMQQLCDNPFILLFLGVASPTILYIVWGVIEVAQLPIAQ